MTILSDIIAGELGGRGAAALVERTPVPKTPSAQARRPTPGPMAAPDFPMGYRSPSLEDSTDVQPATPFDRDDDDDGPTGGTRYPVTQGRGPVFNISVVTPMSSARRAEIDSRNQRLDVQFGQGLVGMKDIYNPATGRYAASAPKMGLFGVPLLGIGAMLGDAFMKKKQKEAALSAAMGNENSGVIMVNDSVIAVVDGKVYGNTPDHIPRHQVQNAIRDFVRNTPASKKSGDYYDISQGGLGKIPLPQSPEEQNRPIIPPPPPPPAPPPAPFYEAGRSDDSDRNYGRTEYSISGGAGTSQKPGGFSMRAEGGSVEMARGGSADPVQGNGFVDGSPDNYTKSQTVADDEYRRLRPGSFVMNAPMTEKLQEAGVLPTGVDNPAKKSTIKVNKGGMIDVALSKGEYVFEPEEAEEIGYDVLNKLNDQGKAEVDRRQALQGGGEPQPAGTDLSRIPPLAAGLRPKIKRDTKPEGFISTQSATQDTGIPPLLINGINVEQVGKALSLVETRGYEDRNDGYFYTRADTKSNPSSAFGPLQITGDTLAAMLEESDELRIQMNEDINPGFANYLERYATDARNRTNFRAFGLIYEGEKGKKAKGRAPTAAEKEMYKGLGAGSISLEDHKKYYPLLANIYLRYKAGMSDSEEDMVRRHFGNDKSTQKYRDAKIELGIN
tara:strand:+ start:85 stop:2091 length:2007 start_codon:yes stop_codon:yes gene_type:complete